MISKYAPAVLADCEILPVTQTIMCEWADLMASRTVWSSRKVSEIADELQGGFGRDVPTCDLFDMPYRRFYPAHAEVIPVLLSDALGRFECWAPLVDLIDKGGVHYHAVGGLALIGLFSLVVKVGRPPWPDPPAVQAYYPGSSSLRQHLSLRVVDTGEVQHFGRENGVS